MKRVLLPWLGPLLVLVVLLIRWQGPAPKAANAPPHEFSAARAFGIEQQLFAGLGPHPIGSPAAPAPPPRGPPPPPTPPPGPPGGGGSPGAGSPRGGCFGGGTPRGRGGG